MRSSESWLLRRVEIGGTVADCRLGGGRVLELGHGLDEVPGEVVLDARGGALLPGLADHHVHVLALAAARASVDLAGATHLSAAPDAAGTGWLRVVGAGSELWRRDVDERWGDRPVRVQHRSGALWTLSSAAVEALASGLTALERESGQVWRDDLRLRGLLADVQEERTDGVRDVGHDLASWGLTHLTEASPELDITGLELVRRSVPQHVLSMSAAGDGPRKLVLPDHGDHDYSALRAAVTGSHTDGRAVAIHAVSAVTLAMSLAVFDEVGVLEGDRVEHAAVCDDGAARRLADLGLTVVTQPTVFARHGPAFVRESRTEERSLLWRHRGLESAGVHVVVSSDAPYGDADPAATIQACSVRTEEGVGPGRALASFLLAPQRLSAGPREVTEGVEADLCLLSQPLAPSLESARNGAGLGVRATFVSGAMVFGGLTPSSL